MKKVSKKKVSKKVAQPKRPNCFIYIGADGVPESNYFRGIQFDKGVATQVTDPAILRKILNHPHFKAG